MKSRKRSKGCSGCLIEAIELRDEQWLHELLSAPNIEYCDTYWAPIESVRMSDCIYLSDVQNLCQKKRIRYTSKMRFRQKCSHRIFHSTPMSGKPANIALSVVLTAMQQTTSNFDAFRMLVESHKFDMNDHIIFHLRHRHMMSVTGFTLFQMVPIAVALLVDKGVDMDDPNSFLLLKTLSRSFQNLEMILISRDVYVLKCPNPQEFLYNFDDTQLFFRPNGALDFLYFCSRYLSSCDMLLDKTPLSNLRLLKALCALGVCLNPRVYSCISNSKSSDADTMGTPQETVCADKGDALLVVLTNMFEIGQSAESEFFVSQCIRFGWIGAANMEPDDADVLSRLLDSVPVGTYTSGYLTISNSPDLEMRFRIARQLLALGIFRAQIRHRFYQCSKCYKFLSPNDSYENVIKHRTKCSDARALSLQTEFLQNPLSLHQLSRAAIRRSLGMNDFERRVQTLWLPRRLREYVWFANEMLADVTPPQGFGAQPVFFRL